MKKKVLLSSAAVLLATVLVGCGNNQSSDSKASSSSMTNEKVTLKMGALESAYGDKMWPAIIEAYQKANPNVTIELTQSKEIENELSPKMKAGEYPDVVLLATGRKAALTDTLIKEKALEDISDVFSMKVPGEEKTVSEKLLNNVEGSGVTDPYADGKHYMAPMFYAPTGLFYNKTLFAQKGWEVPKDMDAMKALAEKAKADGISLLTYPVSGYFDSFFPTMLANAGGPELFQKVMKYDTDALASEQTKKVFDAFGTLLQNVEPTTVANANPQNFTKNQQLVLDNKALFMPNGTWVVEEMKDAPRADGFEWAMAAAPAIEKGGKQYAFSFFEQVWVPKDAKNKEEAKKFIAYLYSDEAAAIFAKNGAVQPIKGITEKLDDKQKALYSFVDTVEGVITGGFAATKPVEGVNIAETVYGQIDSVASGQKTVAEWLKSVQDVSMKLKDNLQ